MPRVISNPGKRAVLTFHDDHVEKRYHDREDMHPEYQWYMLLGGMVAPHLLDADILQGVLRIELGEPIGEPCPEELYGLLRWMEARGIHHRDVHPGNLVRVQGGLRIIDWETAIRCEGVPSYDLYGPDVSGVSVPVIHSQLRSGYQMWWNSRHRASVKSRWGVDVNELPGNLGRRQGSD